MNHISNIPFENKQFTNRYISSDNIFFNKAYLSIFCIISKATFAKDVDDKNDNNFKLIAYSLKYEANKLFTKDNYFQKSIISTNIAKPLSVQELLGVKSLKKIKHNE